MEQKTNWLKTFTAPLRPSLLDWLVPSRRREKQRAWEDGEAQAIAARLGLARINQTTVATIASNVTAPAWNINAIAAPAWNINAIAVQPAGNVNSIAGLPQFAIKRTDTD